MAILALTDPGQVREPPRRDPPARERPRSAPPAREVYFANCTAARAAGRENIRRGQPGYRPPAAARSRQRRDRLRIPVTSGFLIVVNRS